MPIPARQIPPSTDPAQEGRILVKYENYIGAVAYKAWSKYGYIFRLDEEDFRQEGRLALMTALRFVDWSYNTKKIDNFLKKKIWASMIDFVRTLDPSRSTQWRRHGVSVDVVLGIEANLGEDYFLPADEYPIVEMLDLIGKVNSVLDGVRSERDRQIILLALQGYDNVQISGMVNGNGSKCGPSRVSQILSASGLFQYLDKDLSGKGRRIKADVSRSTMYNRRKKKCIG